MGRIKTKSFNLAVYAKGEENSPKLALVLPGRLDTKDYPHMRSHVGFLATKGFFALSFDPPGTWESAGSIETYSMTNYLKAINELIEHFGSKPTFVMGHSRGGTMAMLAATTNPKIIGFAAVMSNYEGSAAKTEMKPGDVQVEYRDLPGNPEEKKRIDLPYAYFKDASQYNMLEGLKTYKKPKLFFWGNKDIMAKSEDVKHAYGASAEPKELHELNSAHDYRYDNKLIEEVNITVGAFLSKLSGSRMEL